MILHEKKDENISQQPKKLKNRSLDGTVEDREPSKLL